MKSTVYAIIKELGNEPLHRYIYENIAENQFDSHRITNYFHQFFKDYYERMLIALGNKNDITNKNVIIANSIGNYLGRNQRELQIEKIGKVISVNMNGNLSSTSLWQKVR